MKTSDFDYHLPAERIADQPRSPRDAARMLHVGAALRDRKVGDLPDLLTARDILVVNNTKVLPARLRGHRGTAKVEVTLLKPVGPTSWQALARPAKRLRRGDRIDFAPDFGAEVAAKGERGEITLAFEERGPALIAALERHGEMPLPPYIARPAGALAIDRTDYQTIFAAHEGAVAAPTAGLHFSSDLVATLTEKDIDIAEITLHVGAGTFLPVRTERIEDHQMHEEWGCVNAATAQTLNEARAAGGRIVAVGTTVTRLLETAAATGKISPFEGQTDIFSTPGYRFKAVDLLLTNFHLPRSTLLMLVAAFAGHRRILDAYAHAMEAGYRFYSYGDCCLLEPGQ